jgi:hypothetical protein
VSELFWRRLALTPAVGIFVLLSLLPLANLIAIFHDASRLTIHNDAILGYCDLVNSCGFG